MRKRKQLNYCSTLCGFSEIERERETERERIGWKINNPFNFHASLSMQRGGICTRTDMQMREWIYFVTQFLKRQHQKKAM